MVIMLRRTNWHEGMLKRLLLGVGITPRFLRFYAKRIGIDNKAFWVFLFIYMGLKSKITAYMEVLNFLNSNSIDCDVLKLSPFDTWQMLVNYLVVSCRKVNKPEEVQPFLDRIINMDCAIQTAEKVKRLPYTLERFVKVLTRLEIAFLMYHPVSAAVSGYLDTNEAWKISLVIGLPIYDMLGDTKLLLNELIDAFDGEELRIFIQKWKRRST